MKQERLPPSQPSEPRAPVPPAPAPGPGPDGGTSSSDGRPSADAADASDGPPSAEGGRADAPRGVRHSLRAFRHRDFTIFWGGALVSSTGSWLSNLAVPYVLYEITGSAFWVGLVSLAQFLPSVFLSPVGGTLADRRSRKRILLVTQSGMAVSALLLWLVWTSGQRDPVVMLVLVSLGGVFAGFNMPTWQSFVSDLVPRGDLHSAVTLNSLQFNTARSLGPALAGLLLAVLGPAWTFLLNAVSFLFVLAALAAIHPRAGRPQQAAPAGMTRRFLAAPRYIRRQPGLVMALVVSVLVGVLGHPIFQFTVVFAGSVFEAGPVGLGLLNAALGLGAVVAAPLVSGWHHKLRLGLVVRWGLVLYGLSMIAFGAAPGYAWGVAALIVVGGSFLAVISSVNTSIQVIVADGMRGRVMACRIMTYTASLPVGGLLQGVVADWAGPRWAVCGAGALMAVAAVTLMRLRGRARLDRLDDPHDDSHLVGSAS
ncbi:MFS transporter [Nonomuraea roseoviolacea]|uniref:MFS family arabinose efflux permease n=1 Tax=Nonomuraea roseoviolacea subsp. carminata TaxID=160689 RepID=A0ABT1KFN3_9ACTN|nr:MFS transporter [Nonomuraea roseoviolacea]MCP2352831.1 putative MFS family arabinose efflux permease [Nonomuraea roseoviolacea subsp. carminata]